jgi:hypothetical protein
MMVISVIVSELVLISIEKLFLFTGVILAFLSWFRRIYQFCFRSSDLCALGIFIRGSSQFAGPEFSSSNLWLGHQIWATWSRAEWLLRSYLSMEISFFEFPSRSPLDSFVWFLLSPGSSTAGGVFVFCSLTEPGLSRGSVSVFPATWLRFLLAPRAPTACDISSAR